ncbi:hypothetical protein QA612_21355 [Evansella sp. AB-P1]|uniref:TIGR04104 family putative zinc finger protein n=1 Tax=Evansella sp. AB-P1 TaxID=3037653 RepID=UPI00241E3180|nr:TIGR04104 family putative zinc finger protein [Evansella sp. AB-P1]MDG5790007.1 hypothetical protein [Evansella sp. AB-P1]
MPTCKNCKQDWTWKQTVKSGFTMDIGMKCPHCDKKQYLTSKSRKKTGLSIIAIPFTLIIPVLFEISSIIAISIFIGTALIVFGINPILTDLSNEEEQLW